MKKIKIKSFPGLDWDKNLEDTVTRDCQLVLLARVENQSGGQSLKRTKPG